MITEKQLNELEFYQFKQSEQYYSLGWDYMFDNITQELFSHNECDGTLELLVKVNSLGHLQRALESMTL